MTEKEMVLEPEKILAECEIVNNHNVADFGCGPGIFSIPVARMTEGTVYCFDVLESALEAVESRAVTFGLTNIITRRVNLEKEGGSGLNDGEVQHVIMRRILVQNENKIALFSEANRVLSQDGNLLVIGWNKENMQNMNMSYDLTEKHMEEFARDTGFILHKKIDAGMYHYALIFKKQI